MKLAEISVTPNQLHYLFDITKFDVGDVYTDNLIILGYLFQKIRQGIFFKFELAKIKCFIKFI